MEKEPTIDGRTLVALMTLVLALVCLLVGIVASIPQLPPRVASHFDSAGVPDGWMERGTYLWFMSLLAFGMALFMVGVFYSIRYFSPSLINLPNRDYWLAPERRDQTYATMFRFGIWLATLQTALISAAHVLVVQANRSQPPVLSSAIWVLLVAFLLATGVWSYCLIQQFRRPK